MPDRTARSLAVYALGATLIASAPLAASAQTGVYYTQPKVVSQATTSVPIAGTGAVTVQVFVHKNGSVGTVKVEKSTNHADDPAALDIAKNSTYKPGLKDGKPVDAFYTMVLRFNGTTVVNDTGTSSSQLIQANALIRAGKYDDARTQIQAYLTGHPNDQDAEALLGAADYYLKDNAGAAAAFTAAGTVPERFKVVAGEAYSAAAIDALKAKNNDQAIAYADKALAIQQNVNTLYIRGTAYANAQRYPQAIADLEKAKALASTGTPDQGTLNLIDSSLATTYIFSGQVDKANALRTALKQRDPSNTRVDDALATYYNQQAVTANKAGNTDEAVADLENAAKIVPSRALVMYIQAANVLASVAKPDWKRVKAEADKALAIDGNDARANYVAGIALANNADAKGALTYLQKAKANAGSDAALNADIDKALKQLGQK